MIISKVLGAGVLTGTLVLSSAAVPAEAAAPATEHLCKLDAPGGVRLLMKVRLPHLPDDRSDLHGVLVRVTDRFGAGGFRDARVDMRRLFLSIERSPESVGGGQISSAEGITSKRAHVFWDLDPRSSGANVSKVTATARFRLPDRTRVKATCRVMLG